jgi:surfeit locus 1 family protein
VLAFLKTRRGAVALSIVIMLAFFFINLGFWQLDRHDQRALENQVMSARLSADAIPVTDLLEAAGSNPESIESLEYRPTTAQGEFRPDLELLIRNMTNNGRAGYHVVTPLEQGDGSFILVNRGWVPLEMDTVPVAAPPPSGRVDVTGLVRLTQLRPAVGQVEPEGVLTVASRIDIDRLSRQVPGEVAPVWVQALGSRDQLPVPVEEPDFVDPGPHIMYAVQWFSFTLIGVVGFWFLVRNQVKAPPPAKERSLV